MDVLYCCAVSAPTIEETEVVRMCKYSLKTIAMLFPQGSPQRLYLHGLWQLSRKKNPAMLPDGETNAWRAFAQAGMECGDYIDAILEPSQSRDQTF